MAWYNNPEFQKYLSGAAQGVTDVFTGVTPQDRMQVDLKQWALEQDRLRREEYMNYLRDQAASREAFQESSLAQQQERLKRQIDRDTVLMDQGAERLAIQKAADETATARQKKTAQRQRLNDIFGLVKDGADPLPYKDEVMELDLSGKAWQSLVDVGETARQSPDVQAAFAGTFPSSDEIKGWEHQLTMIASQLIPDPEGKGVGFEDIPLDIRGPATRRFYNEYGSLPGGGRRMKESVGPFVRELLQSVERELRESVERELRER